MTALAKITRLAWAAFLGGAALGFSYLVLVRPVGSRSTESLIVLGMVAAGATAGIFLDVGIQRMLAGLRARVDLEEIEGKPAEASAPS